MIFPLDGNLSPIGHDSVAFSSVLQACKKITFKNKALNRCQKIGQTGKRSGISKVSAGTTELSADLSTDFVGTFSLEIGSLGRTRWGNHISFR